MLFAVTHSDIHMLTSLELCQREKVCLPLKKILIVALFTLVKGIFASFEAKWAGNNPEGSSFFFFCISRSKYLHSNDGHTHTHTHGISVAV